MQKKLRSINAYIRDIPTTYRREIRRKYVELNDGKGRVTNDADRELLVDAIFNTIQRVEYMDSGFDRTEAMFASMQRVYDDITDYAKQAAHLDGL